ncbi:MAG: hypothetical protein QM781_17865 [Chitinophagaceae bacterium]
MEIQQVIERYLNKIITDEFHRYKSWDNCHQSFMSSDQADSHVLNLAFYLASWGMYRGSSGLLQKNHLIHKGAVDILFSSDGQKLKCSVENEVSKRNIKDILKLKEKLSNHYSGIIFTKGADQPKPVTPTDTLLSKIMLGALGCIPAYDRYFIDGLKEKNIQSTSFNDRSLNELFDFSDKNKSEIVYVQKIIKRKAKRHYPLMKILDMYFWQIGFEKEGKSKE